MNLFCKDLIFSNIHQVFENSLNLCLICHISQRSEIYNYKNVLSKAFVVLIVLQFMLLIIIKLQNKFHIIYRLTDI
jgi:hypothetical protein